MMDTGTLESMRYADLQKLAKTLGIKANIKVKRGFFKSHFVSFCFLFMLFNICLSNQTISILSQ